MLKITNLHAEIDGKEILKGLSFTVNAGEVHAIMGPNGAGKSTLGYVLGGRPGYEVTGGSVMFRTSARDDHPHPVRPELVEGPSFSSTAGEKKDGASTSSARTGEGGSAPTEGGVSEAEGDWIDLLALDPHERAAAGLFLGFQYPVEIPGVSNVQFLREALNAQRRNRDEKPLSGAEFLKIARAEAASLDMDAEMLKRPVNVGFSGGEKKRNEMVQMGVIAPRLAVLDETDSGLDIDALRIVADGINRVMRGADKAVVIITHYQRLLEYVRPDFVHVLDDGVITRTGGPELAHELEREGYAGVAA